MAEQALIDGLVAYAKAALPADAPRGPATLMRLRHIVEATALASAPIHQRLGLDAGGLAVLTALRVAPPPHKLRPTALAHMLGLSSGGLTARLNRLELARLIRRTAASDDRRSSWVALTNKGRALAEEALAEEIALQAQIAGALTEKEQWVLGTLLAKLDGQLAAMVAPAADAA
jgi:DNA-binding MarR family transcriptional regulator